MKKEIELTILYDYYGELFTEKQKEYFNDYYLNNLSLSEISDNLNVSRNAVHKQLKAIEEKLYYYEDKLHLYERDCKLKELVTKISNSDLKEQIIKTIEGE